MSNKRFDQFTYGVPGSSDLLLWADPTTGEIKKCLISDVGGSGGGGYSDSIIYDTNNSGTNPQNFGALTIPSSELDNIGKLFRVSIFLRILSTTGTPVVWTLVQSASNVNITGTVTGIGQMDTYIIRTDASTVQSFGRSFRVNSISNSSSNFQTHAIALGGTFSVEPQQTAGGANTMYLQSISAFAV